MNLPPIRFQPDERIDLHVHSHYSDGRYAPSVLADLAARKNLTAIALTDHATVDGIMEMIEAGAQAGVHVIPGVELNAKGADLLGLFVDYQDQQFLSFLKTIRRKRLDHIKSVVNALNDFGFPMKLDDLLRFAQPGLPTTATLARVLVNKGAFPDVHTVSTFLLGKGAPAHRPLEMPAVETCVQAIHDAGGVAVEAHPLRRYEDFRAKDLMAFYAKMKQQGLDGYEAMAGGLANWCESAGSTQRGSNRGRLVAVGGSNFHGSPISSATMGDQFTTGDVLADLMSRLPANCVHKDILVRIPRFAENLAPEAFRAALKPSEIRMNHMDMQNLLERSPSCETLPDFGPGSNCVLIGPGALDMEGKIMANLVQAGAKIHSKVAAPNYPELFWALNRMYEKPAETQEMELIALNVVRHLHRDRGDNCKIVHFELPAGISLPALKTHLQQEIDLIRTYRVRFQNRVETCMITLAHLAEIASLSRIEGVV